MKNRNILLTIIIIIIVLLFSSCKHKTYRSFYYWKSVYHLSKQEITCLEQLNISKLYIRFFDVGLEESSGKIIPLAKISFAEKISPRNSVVPVIYIVNRTLQKSKQPDIKDLAAKILSQVNILASENNIAFNELQMDCDWTESTRSNYFELLNELKKNLNSGGKILSATIRLHQVKYKQITGVPPVDRGMLMFYNMGKITAESSSNSVFNENDASKYIDLLSEYPLKLDIVLPAFSWGIHIRNGKVFELLNNLGSVDFSNNILFNRIDNSTYSATKSFFYRGYYFMHNDLVKIEEITPEQCKAAAQQLKSKLSKSAETVAIFHLDSIIISHYEIQDFEKVFTTFN
jgi:hypothetical protein